jgi:hypothetical protein
MQAMEAINDATKSATQQYKYPQNQEQGIHIN